MTLEEMHKLFNQVHNVVIDPTVPQICKDVIKYDLEKLKSTFEHSKRISERMKYKRVGTSMTVSTTPIMNPTWGDE